MTLLPGLSRDTILIKRPGADVDDEGNPTEVLSTVTAVSGTWGSPSYQDLSRAAQAGMVIDAVVATSSTELRLGDTVVVHDDEYRAIAIANARTHRRVFLRRAE